MALGNVFKRQYGLNVGNIFMKWFWNLKFSGSLWQLARDLNFWIMCERNRNFGLRIISPNLLAFNFSVESNPKLPENLCYNKYQPLQFTNKHDKNFWTSNNVQESSAKHGHAKSLPLLSNFEPWKKPNPTPNMFDTSLLVYILC